jgi:hypothetical protein
LRFKCDVLWSMLDALMVPGKGADYELGRTE